MDDVILPFAKEQLLGSSIRWGSISCGTGRTNHAEGSHRSYGNFVVPGGEGQWISLQQN